MNTDYILRLEIDSNGFLLYLHEFFYQINKLIENLNLYNQITAKCAKEKCVSTYPTYPPYTTYTIVFVFKRGRIHKCIAMTQSLVNEQIHTISLQGLT